MSSAEFASTPTRSVEYVQNRERSSLETAGVGTQEAHSSSRQAGRRPSRSSILGGASNGTISAITEIDRQLKQALGNKSPREVWDFILWKVAQFSLDSPMEFELEAGHYNDDQPLLMLDMLKACSCSPLSHSDYISTQAYIQTEAPEPPVLIIL